VARTQLSGGAYAARSVIASCQRSLNLFCEVMPSGSPMSPTAGQGEPAPFAYYPTCGLTLLAALPQGPVRGLWCATNGNVYAVAGQGVYSLSAAWAPTLLGSLPAGRTTPVSMCDNGLDLVIVDGSAGGWTVHLASNAFAAIADSTGAFVGADRIDFLDTFFILNSPGTPQFYSSNSLATTFDPLYFANKEAFSDLLVCAAVAKLEIWLIGTKTTEVFFNSGASLFPFERMPGVFIDHGCCARYSVAVLDNSVLWLSQDRDGRGVVLKGAGYAATRISTYAIEDEISRYPMLSDAIGMAYQVSGHAFYALTFPTADKTWCYDLGVGQWHELAWLDWNGVEHRHRANCAAYSQRDGIVLVGDHESGAIYHLDRNNYTDNGVPIKRQRSFPHSAADGKRVSYRQFVADMQTGQG
jgi:hypothetical protein